MYCSGDSDYSEFPILKSGDYDGDSPGADRVIFADNGDYCAYVMPNPKYFLELLTPDFSVVTHTGASGNNFVSCEGD